jgi:hypothetical protein
MIQAYALQPTGSGLPTRYVQHMRMLSQYEPLAGVFTIQ